MRYCIIPGTDMKVSEACLGTMTYGESLFREDICSSVRYAFEHGVNFFDTADVYPLFHNGDSERLLGEAIRPIRDRIILATKAGGPMGPGVDDRGLGRKHLIQAAEDSLTRLGTDVIDLYYLHFPDPDVPPEEIVETMALLRDQGKIRYWGVSNYPAWKVCELMYLSGNYGPVAFEGVYNPISRSADDELLPFLKSHPMSLVTYNPLAGGLLTGKYTKNATSGRLIDNPGYRKRYHNPEQVEASLQLEEIAASMGMTLLEFSYLWLRSQSAVNSVIVGYSTPAQLEQNLKFFEKDNLPDFPEEKILSVWKSLDRKCHPYAKF